MHPGCDKAMSTTVIQPQVQYICPFCRQDQLQNEVENMANGNKETERKNGERKKERTTNIKLNKTVHQDRVEHTDSEAEEELIIKPTYIKNVVES